MVYNNHKILLALYEPRCEKTGLWGFRAVQPQTMARGLKFQILEAEDCTLCVGKTKALISCALSAKLLIYVFVFAYAKKRFPHNMDHILVWSIGFFYNNSNNNVFILRGLHIKYKHELI